MPKRTDISKILIIGSGPLNDALYKQEELAPETSIFYGQVEEKRTLPPAG